MISKEYLRRTISDKLASKVRKELSLIQEEVIQTQESLVLLDETDLQKAKYTVEVISYFIEEGERCVVVDHEGTIEEAIKKAEEEFKTINHTDKVRADISVKIYLGKKSHPVPEELWEQYCEGYSAKKAVGKVLRRIL